ncbi:P-loop containing nucleoside triphosphate hydrolase protein [Marasmius fiardii PR-910]|nr:P-loop containing nucleoside triphosphate hydrolase protein [Marasmius fiardii PR-910]
MDLEDFESLTTNKATTNDPPEHELIPTKVNASGTPVDRNRKVLRFFDIFWYVSANRQSRRMDLIGDYGGKEFFVIEGDSLLSMILDDSQLALGQDDPSFQILHAYFLLEKLIHEFQSRDANFSIVFFEDNRHLSIATGQSRLRNNARALARKMMFEHLHKQELGLDIQVFQNPHDLEWRAFCARARPMFIMANDGGSDTIHTELESARRVLARRFLLDISKSGLPFALMNGAEYRDSSIVTFVFESRISVQALILPKPAEDACLFAKKSLDEALGLLQIAPLMFDGSSSVEVSLRDLVRKGLGDAAPEELFLFLLHSASLSCISVSSRARQLPLLKADLLTRLTSFTLPSIYGLLASSVEHTPDLDGRVFLEIIWFLVNEGGSLQSFPVHIVEQVQRLWRSNDGPPLDLASFAKKYENPRPTNGNQNREDRPTYTLLPFENSVFDAALASVKVPQSDVDKPSKSIFGDDVLLQDTQHWHNRSRSILPSYLGGRTTQPTDAWERKRWLKKEQRAQANVQEQAASLAGASGKMLQKVVIPSVGTKHTRESKKREGVVRENGKPSDKAKKMTGADKARAKIQEEKTKKLEREASEWLASKLRSFSKDTLDEQLAKLEDVKRSQNANANFPLVAVQLRVYEVHLRLKKWTNLGPTKGREVRDQYIVSILRLLQDIKALDAPISEDCSKFLTDICSTFGLSACTEALLPQTDKERPGLPFKSIKLLHKREGDVIYPFMKIDIPHCEWQLANFGDFMDRSVDSARDNRVSFAPDRWQRRILDAIDNHDSVLALAPTSAGKTFISFYAMEKVLRESDRGVVVYVAPTKALVNQIAAEVYGRFSKIYKGNETLLAVHTRDTQVGDIQRAQILVTVPEMLGILLLSPTLAENWTSRIQRIILDEIHSIGQDEGGTVWEQIILMAPCPIIGLSATVGSPEKFNGWLESVQVSHEFGHTYVHHPTRYSHLRKFFYDPPKSEYVFTGLNDHTDSQGMHFIHPLSLLDAHSTSIPSDLALEARDCLTLYKALKSRSLTPASLEPEKFFADIKGFISQRDVLRYEEKLKNILTDIIKQERKDDDDFTAVISLLKNPILNKNEADRIMDRKQFKDNLLVLVCDLHAQKSLPAVFFSFDRMDCEIMAWSLTRALAIAEKKWRETSPQWKSKLVQVEKWREQEKSRQRQREREARQKKDKDDVREDTSSTSWEASFNENDPSPDFSLAGRFSGTKQDLHRLFWRLRKWGNTPGWALLALKRGIAVHHAGMSKMYRTTIENLFRQGFISVMISTGTLALGINAPAKTSVFTGDSPYLTALMYRQCSGRAGRRGFDLRGNVVFYGLPYSRVQRLVLSQLPDLGDSFPLTTTLILRFFNLLAGSGNADFSVNCIKSILNLPRISHRSEFGQDQILHHVRFSIEYLRSSGLLNMKGQPTNLFGMASHLYYTEPSNFALVHLFESGIIHDICSGSEVEAESELLLLLAHLFGRTFIPSNAAQPQIIAGLRKVYPSNIVLPNLSARIGEKLHKHDRKILDIFSGYAISYANEHMQTVVDDALPLSGVYPTEHSSTSNPFFDHLVQTSLRPIARSIFAANSGLDDNFRSVKDLVHTVRKGIHLHEHAIPSMMHFVAYSDVESPNALVHQLNGYLVDFYTHGQVSTLAAANGIRKGDVWYMLQNFDLILKTIKSSLQELLLQLSAARSKESDAGSSESGNEYESEEDSNSEEDVKDEDVEIQEFKRPPGTTEEDWRVYKVVERIAQTFNQKFRDMWA